MTMPWDKYVKKTSQVKLAKWKTAETEELTTGEKPQVTAKTTQETTPTIQFPEQPKVQLQGTANMNVVSKQPGYDKSATLDVADMSPEKLKEQATNAILDRYWINKTAQDLTYDASLEQVERSAKTLKTFQKYAWAAWNLLEQIWEWASKIWWKIIWIDTEEEAKQSLETTLAKWTLAITDPQIESASKNITEITKGTYASQFAENPEQQIKVSAEWTRAATKNALVNAYDRTIYKYWTKLGFELPKVEAITKKDVNIADLYSNKWLSADWNTIFMNNWDTTIEKPVIKENDYKALLQDAYNWVTNTLATQWVLLTVEDIKKYYPEWENVPDEEINRFLNACWYDVQEWKRRNINDYYENFMDMSFTDSYKSQNDNMIQLMSNTSFINNGLAQFLNWDARLDSISKEQLSEFVTAANQLQGYADMIRNMWYAPEWASDYAILNTYAKTIPEIKEAIANYKKVNLSEKDFIELSYVYSKNLQDTENVVAKIWWATPEELKELIRKESRAVLAKFSSDMHDSWLKEQVDNDTVWKDVGEIPILGKMLVWNHYTANWKYYDLDWNEIKPKDAEKDMWSWWIDNLINLWTKTETLGTDLTKLSEDISDETVANVAFDIPNVMLAAYMAMPVSVKHPKWKNLSLRQQTKAVWWWLKFYTETKLPIYWEMLESWMDLWMSSMWDIATNTSNFIWLTEWWSDESKEKMAEAAWALGFMMFDMMRKKVTDTWYKKLEKYWSETAIKKWLDAFKESYKNKLKDNEQKYDKIRKEIESRDIPEDQKAEYKKWTEKDRKEDRNIIYTKWAFEDAVEAFKEAYRKAVEEDYKKKELDKDTKTLTEALYELAWMKVEEMRVNRSEWSKDVSQEKPAETTETTPIEQISTEPTEQQKTAWEITEQPTVSAQETPQLTTPETKVEWVTERPEEIKWTATTPTDERASKLSDQIKKITDLIKKIENTAQELYGKIHKEDVEKSSREKEEDWLRKEEEFKRMWLSQEEIDTLRDNPFTDLILDVVNEATTPITEKGKIKNVDFSKRFTKDEIERKVLEAWIQKIQEYIDKMLQNKSDLWKLYEELSTDPIYKTEEFVNSPELKEILDSAWLEVREKINEDLTSEYVITKKDWSLPKATEEKIIKYLENVINSEITQRSRISEKDAHAIRTKLTDQKTREKTWDYPAAIAKELSFAWNKFLERKWWSELLRKIDEWFSKIKEDIDTFKDLLSKDNKVKDNAKNKILNLDEERINELDQMFPWIRNLIELAKISDRTVSWMISARTKTKGTREWLASPIRYTFVALPTLIWWAMWWYWWWVIWLVVWSFIFKWSNMLWNKLANAIRWKEPDLDSFNQLVDALNVEWNKKAEIKQQMLEDFKTLSEQFKNKTEQEINQIWSDAIEIELKRKADKAAQEQARVEYIRQKEQELRDKINAGKEEQEKFKKPDTPALWENNLRLEQKDYVQETPASTSQEWDIIVSWPGGTNRVFRKWEDIRFDLIQNASIWARDTSTNPVVNKVVDTLEKIENTVSDAIIDHAGNNLVEKWEAPTKENIKKELEKDTTKEDDIMSFLNDIEEWTPNESGKITNYDWASIKDLQEVVDHPEKYPNVDIEAAKKALDKAVRQQTEADILASETWLQEYYQNVADITSAGEKERKWKNVDSKREDVVRRTNRDVDSLETTEEYDRIEKNTSRETQEKAEKISKWYKWWYREDKAVADDLRQAMWRWWSQNIAYTNTAENIAKLKNPATRKKVAQERIDKVVDMSINTTKNKLAIAKSKNKNVAKAEADYNKWVEQKAELEKIIEESDAEINKNLEQTQELKNINTELKKIKEEQKSPRTTNSEKKKLEKKKQTLIKKAESAMKPSTLEQDIAEAKAYIEKLENEKASWKTINWFGGEADRDPIFDEKALTNAKEYLSELESKLNTEKPQVVSSKSEWKTTQETKVEQEPAVDTFYHASDTTDISEFDLNKTKPDMNWIWLAVNTKPDNAYKDKPWQYQISWKDFKIAKSDTTISEDTINKICEDLWIDPNQARQYVPLPELSSIIQSESWKTNKEVITTLSKETWYDWVNTSHDYTLLWNMEKVNKNIKNVSKTNQPSWDKPLIKVTREWNLDQSEPMVGDIETSQIKSRIDYLTDKRKRESKLYAQEKRELIELQKLYKRQVESEWEKQLDDRWKKNRFNWDDSSFDTRESASWYYTSWWAQWNEE